MIIKMIMEDLIHGNSFYTSIDEEIVFNQLDYSEDAIWSLLLASGYLKVVGYGECDEEGCIDEYSLAFTNLEVKRMFRKIIRRTQ